MAPSQKSTRCASIVGIRKFYRRFIKGYSKVVEPLTRLTRKGLPFKWETKQQESFDRLKTSFTTAPILRLLDHDRNIVVETDASEVTPEICRVRS